MIAITVTKSELAVRAEETLTSGSVHADPVRFKFSPDWDGLTKTAVFKAGSRAISVVLDDTGECTVPWETLEKPGYVLEVGVYGVRGDAVVLPTVWGAIGTIQQGAQPGENAREPTPTVYEQLIVQLDEGRSAAQAAADQAKADAGEAARLAEEMATLADQVSWNTVTVSMTVSMVQAEAVAAQRQAEAAQSAAETARQAAEDAALAAGTDAETAAAAAARAEAAAGQAAAALAELQALYQQMQTCAAQVIQDIQTEGDTQVARVTAEGTAQTAAARAEADRAETAQAGAEAARDEAEALAYLIDEDSGTTHTMAWSVKDGFPVLTLTEREE